MIELARKLIPENVGFAATDMRIGVEVQLLICTFEMTGVIAPKIPMPCAASLMSELFTGMATPVMFTTPFDDPVEPNLRRQRESEPVDPATKLM